jgi:hypothetical protein
MNEAGNYHGIMATKQDSIHKSSVKSVSRVQCVIAVEVPGFYFITQGVSPHRDIDYVPQGEWVTCAVQPSISSPQGELFPREGGSRAQITWVP